jgi:CRP-like cAMP-binding protein
LTQYRGQLQNSAFCSTGENDSGLIKVSKGRVIIHQGDRAGHWFEVVKGSVRTCRFYLDGHRQLTGFYFKGDVFGLEFGHYSATAEAITDVTLRRTVSTANDIFDNAILSPTRKSAVLEQALDRAQHCIFLLGHRNATERVAAFLLLVAHSSEDENEFELPMSRADIADHLGITIHTVSRSFSELVRQKAIKLQGSRRLQVIDPAKLACLAGELEANAQPAPSQTPSRCRRNAKCAARQRHLHSKIGGIENEQTTFESVSVAGLAIGGFLCFLHAGGLCS